MRKILNLKKYAILILFVYVRNTCSEVIAIDEAVSLSRTEAIAGGVAILLCNVTPPNADDTVSLVIWYKHGLTSPIYSYDSREQSSKNATHWYDYEAVGGRVSFEPGSATFPARLKLQAVKDSDGGLYRCRVDFKRSPTRNHNLDLTVIVSPESLAVRNDKGEPIQNYILGPYVEGSSVNITCISTGGRPPPQVTWWQENVLIDDTCEPLPNRQIRNVLRLERIERKHLNTVFTCQASNNNVVPPIFGAVTLDLVLHPVSVQIIGENRPFSADSTYNFTCQIVGARPTPRVTWWKGKSMMRSAKIIGSEDNNITLSQVTFIPTVEDFGKTLTCRAESHNFSTTEHVYEDSWKLNVHYIPIVTLTFGQKINQSNIFEGMDIHFECIVKSNPWIYKLTWRHNGKVIYNNTGVLISNHTLVLKNVTRMQTGLYTCVGSNNEGDGESSPVKLDIKFVPVCRPGQETTYAVGRNDTGFVVCEIEANPSTNLNFTWRFKGGPAGATTLFDHFTTEQGGSMARFISTGELDYGSLYCWARNELGIQLEPCIYHIIPAGRPNALSDCTITNQTYESVTISCQNDFDGGLIRRFGLQVYDVTSKQMIRNLTSDVATFTITGLMSDVNYDVKLYSYNAKGRSRMSHVAAFTLKSPQKRTGVIQSHIDFRSLIGVFVGCGVLIVLLLLILVVIKIRCHPVNEKKINETQNVVVDSAEKDPDIIPYNEEYLGEDKQAIHELRKNRRYYDVQCVRDSSALPIQEEKNFINRSQYDDTNTAQFAATRF